MFPMPAVSIGAWTLGQGGQGALKKGGASRPCSSHRGQARCRRSPQGKCSVARCSSSRSPWDSLARSGGCGCRLRACRSAPARRAFHTTRGMHPSPDLARVPPPKHPHRWHVSVQRYRRKETLLWSGPSRTHTRGESACGSRRNTRTAS